MSHFDIYCAAVIGCLKRSVIVKSSFSYDAGTVIPWKEDVITVSRIFECSLSMQDHPEAFPVCGERAREG